MVDSWYLDAIWISVAFIGGLLAKRINLPPLVGFLVAGFALNFAGFTSGGIAIEAAANLGVMLLLFTIGLKLNIKSLFKPEIWLATSIQMTIMSVFFGLIIFGLSFSGLYFLADIEITTALVIGFALSFSSTVFAIKILEDRGEVNSFHGKLTIGILIMQDIAAVVYLTITGEGAITLWLIALPVYLLIIRFVLLRLINSVDHGELFTLFGFFAAFVAGAISFKLFGLKADLGALVIGAMLAPHERSKELAKHMVGYKDFFLVAFFLQIGLSGFPGWKDLIIALALTLFLIFKGGFFLVLFTRFKLRARTSWLTALSLSNYSEFGLIIMAIGVQQGFIGMEWMTIIALALSFSFLVSSPINIKAHHLFNKYRHQIARLNKNCVHLDDELTNFDDVEYLVCGMGRIGHVVYHYLHGKYGDKVIGIDYDMELVEKFRDAKKKVFWGDATDSIFWQNAKNSKIKMVFLAMTDHKSNINVAKEISLIPEHQFMVGCTSKFRDEFLELKESGVNYVYNYYDRLGADFAEHFVKHTTNKLDERKNNKAAKTLILGLGNILLQDEGIGVHALNKMTEVKWPKHVDLLDGGTGGFVLLSLFQDYNTIVIIDAALSDDPPGTINVIEPKFAKDFPKSLSTHELGLKDMIESAILLGKVPKLHLITCTINPKQEMNIQLTARIKARIPQIIKTVQDVLEDASLSDN